MVRRLPLSQVYGAAPLTEFFATRRPRHVLFFQTCRSIIARGFMTHHRNRVCVTDSEGASGVRGKVPQKYMGGGGNEIILLLNCAETMHLTASASCLMQLELDSLRFRFFPVMKI